MSDVKMLTVKELRDRIQTDPTLIYGYDGGYLRFWRLSNGSISCLDGVGNRVSFKDDSSYLFREDHLLTNQESALPGGQRRVVQW